MPVNGLFIGKTIVIMSATTSHQYFLKNRARILNIELRIMKHELMHEAKTMNCEW